MIQEIKLNNDLLFKPDEIARLEERRTADDGAQPQAPLLAFQGNAVVIVDWGDDGGMYQEFAPEQLQRVTK